MAPTSSQKSRKVKALLAGGLVLGVGAAVTLAAWTDQEWTQGNFSAGTFNIQSSVDGVDFQDHSTEGTASSLVFDLPLADNLSPDSAVSAPFALRLSGATTYDASVALESVSASGTAADNLTYGIIQVASADACSATATGTSVISSGTPLNSIGTPAVLDLTAGTAGADGEPVTLCFQVTADSQLAQGENATASWQFLGTSK